MPNLKKIHQSEKFMGESQDSHKLDYEKSDATYLINHSELEKELFDFERSLL